MVILNWLFFILGMAYVRTVRTIFTIKMVLLNYLLVCLCLSACKPAHREQNADLISPLSNSSANEILTPPPINPEKIEKIVVQTSTDINTSSEVSISSDNNSTLPTSDTSTAVLNTSSTDVPPPSEESSSSTPVNNDSKTAEIVGSIAGVAGAITALVVGYLYLRGKGKGAKIEGEGYERVLTTSRTLRSTPRTRETETQPHKASDSLSSSERQIQTSPAPVSGPEVKVSLLPEDSSMKVQKTKADGTTLTREIPIVMQASTESRELILHTPPREPGSTNLFVNTTSSPHFVPEPPAVMAIEGNFYKIEMHESLTAVTHLQEVDIPEKASEVGLISYDSQTLSKDLRQFALSKLTKYSWAQDILNAPDFKFFGARLSDDNLVISYFANQHRAEILIKVDRKDVVSKSAKAVEDASMAPRAIVYQQIEEVLDTPAKKFQSPVEVGGIFRPTSSSVEDFTRVHSTETERVMFPSKSFDRVSSQEILDTVVGIQPQLHELFQSTSKDLSGAIKKGNKTVAEHTREALDDFQIHYNPPRQVPIVRPENLENLIRSMVSLHVIGSPIAEGATRSIMQHSLSELGFSKEEVNFAMSLFDSKELMWDLFKSRTASPQLQQAALDKIFRNIEQRASVLHMDPKEYLQLTLNVFLPEIRSFRDYRTTFEIGHSGRLQFNSVPLFQNLLKRYNSTDLKMIRPIQTIH